MFVVADGMLKYDLTKVELGRKKILSQCVNNRSLYHKNAPSIATKIIQQMLSKLGSNIWVPVCSNDIKTKSTYLFSFDIAKDIASGTVQYRENF